MKWTKKPITEPCGYPEVKLNGKDSDPLTYILI